MTKAQRKARAKRAGAVRRKVNAVKAFMRKMNPGKKAPVAVRVKRLKGGGISVTPLKRNAARPSTIARLETQLHNAQRSEMLAFHPRVRAAARRRVESIRRKLDKARTNIAW